jgi:hypothetical protein
VREQQAVETAQPEAAAEAAAEAVACPPHRIVVVTSRRLSAASLSSGIGASLGNSRQRAVREPVRERRSAVSSSF